jgi:hypothetical protein
VAGCAGRALNLAAIVAALAHRGSVGDSSTLQPRADAPDDVRKADRNLSVDQSAAATNAPKKMRCDLMLHPETLEIVEQERD